MKLVEVKIKDFRSFYSEHSFTISGGVNYFVGPNNCGKSNFIRAIELALNPDLKYDPLVDRPASLSGNGAPRKTRITLVFALGTTGPERTLKRKALEYERRLQGDHGRNGGSTYADEGELRVVTEFGSSGARVLKFQTKGMGARSLSTEAEQHIQLEKQFRAVTRSGVVHSGEDIDTLLRGQFQEILGLVIADHLGKELEEAVEAREQYLASLQARLLEPLRGHVEQLVQSVFPEMSAASLVPAVPTVGETLSTVDIVLTDAVASPLSRKGTGVRGAVLLAMMQYLAAQSKRSIVLALEEPEAFLHPAAQEEIRTHLSELALGPDVTLLVTTHSPYVIARGSADRITELRKSNDGQTVPVSSVAGDDDRADALAGLYRDAGFARVIERGLSIPPTARGVLVVEGYTDEQFMRMCLRAAAKEPLLDGVHFIHAGGGPKVVPQMIVAMAGTALPVVALLDSDASGRAARDRLNSFNTVEKAQILMLSDWPDKCRHSHDVEIEDLLPIAPLERAIVESGENLMLDGKEACGGSWHYRISKSGKDVLLSKLPHYLRGVREATGGMEWLAGEVGARFQTLEAKKARVHARG